VQPLLLRQVCVNRPGGLFSGAHGQDDRGGTGKIPLLKFPLTFWPKSIICTRLICHV
jgi:hypothetical protein